MIPAIENENFFKFRTLEIDFASQRRRFAPSVYFMKKSVKNFIFDTDSKIL